MTCLHPFACKLERGHEDECIFSTVGPYHCPNKHWIYFATPESKLTYCQQCGVSVFRGDPQP